MDGDRYLDLYRRNLAHRTATGGLRGRLEGWFRGRLDAKARAQGQDDRHGLALGRVLELCGLAPTGPLTVLEIGAGDGLWLIHKRPGLRCVAVDNGNAFAGEFARRGIAFHARDVTRETLPLEAATADLVMMNHVIEHLPDPSLVLGECNRVLKPGGVLYLRTPDIARVGFAFYDDPTHVRPYTPIALDATVRRFGFTPIFRHLTDTRRTNLDLLTDGRWRRWLLGPRLGGGEIEAGFRRAPE